MNTKAAKKPAKLIFILIYFMGLGLLLSLGGWQLARGLEKQTLKQKIAEKPQQHLLSSTPPSWKELNYKKVFLQGKWLPSRTFLLDNRVHNGKVGYELLNPFQLNDGAILLINHGWIEKPKISEALLSAVMRLSGKIQGQIYQPQKGFTLGSAIGDKAEWPRIAQYYDFQAFSIALGKVISPAVVVLDSDKKNGLTKIWRPYIINASRHFGYAFQWWGLAAVFITFGLIWFRK